MWIWVLNVMTPGAGLIWRGRAVKGALLAAAYVPAAGVVLVAGLIAPAGVPPWLTVAGAAWAGAAWLAAQLWLGRIVSGRRRPALQARLDALLCAAEEQFHDGDRFEALLTLEQLLDLDRQYVPAHLLRGRIYAAGAKYTRAAEAFALARRLDDRGRYRTQIDQALADCEGPIDLERAR